MVENVLGVTRKCHNYVAVFMVLPPPLRVNDLVRFLNLVQRYYFISIYANLFHIFQTIVHSILIIVQFLLATWMSGAKEKTADLLRQAVPI